MILIILAAVYACYLVVTTALFVYLRDDYYIAKRGFGPLLCTSLFQLASLLTLCIRKEMQHAFPCLFSFWGNNFAFPMFIYCAYVARGLSLLHENYWNRLKLQRYSKSSLSLHSRPGSSASGAAGGSPQSGRPASSSLVGAVATQGLEVAGCPFISDASQGHDLDEPEFSRSENASGAELSVSEDGGHSPLTKGHPAGQWERVESPESDLQISSPSHLRSGPPPPPSQELVGVEQLIFPNEPSETIPFFAFSRSLFRWFVLKRNCAVYAILMAVVAHFALNVVHNCLFYWRRVDEQPRLHICIKNEVSMNYCFVSFSALFLSPIVLYCLRGVEDAMKIKRDIRNSIFVGIPIHLYFIVIRNIKSLQYLKAYSPPVLVIFLWVSSFHTLMVFVPVLHVIRTRRRRGVKALDSSAYPCITFEDVKSDSVLLAKFRAFSVKEFSVENIFFWESIQQFKSIFLLVSKYSYDQVFDLASQFAHQLKEIFFSPHSTYELNLGYEYKRTILDRINCNKIHRDTFREAEIEVILHLKTCTFPRFLKHLKEQMQREKQNAV